MKNRILIFLLLINSLSFAQNGDDIQFTTVPKWGNDELLEGKVHHATINDHGVAVYIFVEEAQGWWNKPTFANPVTPIQADSTFSALIVNGGYDQYATQLIAFLVPLSYSPPILSGGELPSVLFSYPYAVTCRPHGNKVISWSGFNWVVKKSIGNPMFSLGPGPNLFNDNDTMVWVDNEERLHMRITKLGNSWHCSELICASTLGYQNYLFDVGSRVDLLDPNIITGLFTWDDCAPFALPPDDFYREIDIEFSRWGNQYNDNAQYVIQPYTASGNLKRFNMNLSEATHSVHTINWQSDSILFNSDWGNSSFSWKYSNPGHIPQPGMENMRINFWLMNGLVPSDNKNAEVIFNSFVTGLAGYKVSNEPVKIFPNPVESGCTIEIHTKEIKDLEIDIIDLQGRMIRKVFGGKEIPMSTKIVWDGNTESEKPADPGLYIIRIREDFKTNYFRVIKTGK